MKSSLFLSESNEDQIKEQALNQDREAVLSSELDEDIEVFASEEASFLQDTHMEDQDMLDEEVVDEGAARVDVVPEDDSDKIIEDADSDESEVVNLPEESEEDESEDEDDYEDEDYDDYEDL